MTEEEALPLSVGPDRVATAPPPSMSSSLMISRRFWHRRRSRTEVRDELGLGRTTDVRTGAGGWGTAAVVKRSGNSAAEGESESDEGTLAGNGERRKKKERKRV